MNDYVTTIRLPMPLYEELKMVADADGISVSEAIRQAITAHIERRRVDPEFQRRLRERIAADKKMLAKMSQSGQSSKADTTCHGDGLNPPIHHDNDAIPSQNDATQSGRSGE